MNQTHLKYWTWGKKLLRHTLSHEIWFSQLKYFSKYCSFSWGHFFFSILANFVTLLISKLGIVQTTNFAKMLLSLMVSFLQFLDASTAILAEIIKVNMKSFLTFSALIIFEPNQVKTSNFRNEMLCSKYHRKFDWLSYKT